MEPSLISCIVPVHNGERYLRQTLESIMAQTYQPLEIILVDDGSTDGTACIAASYGDRIRSLWQPNAGPSPARNLGLSAVRGQFVAFLDADDLWHREKCARQMARFAARPELDLSVTHVRNFWSPELVKGETSPPDHPLMQPVPGYVLSTVLARRAVFETVGLFDSAWKHADKTEWFSRAADHGAVIEVLPDVLVYRRLHETNRSRRNASAVRDEYVDLVRSRIDERRRRGKGN